MLPSRETKNKKSGLGVVPSGMEKEASMAIELMNKRSATKKVTTGFPKGMLQRVEAILAGNYAFMDSPVFKNRNIERELFTFADGTEPNLPLTSWYQPTREDLENNRVTTPQLMSAAE